MNEKIKEYLYGAIMAVAFAIWMFLSYYFTGGKNFIAKGIISLLFAPLIFSIPISLLFWGPRYLIEFLLKRILKGSKNIEQKLSKLSFVITIAITLTSILSGVVFSVLKLNNNLDSFEEVLLFVLESIAYSCVFIIIPLILCVFIYLLRSTLCELYEFFKDKISEMSNSKNKLGTFISWIASMIMFLLKLILYVALGLVFTTLLSLFQGNRP